MSFFFFQSAKLKYNIYLKNNLRRPKIRIHDLVKSQNKKR